MRVRLFILAAYLALTFAWGIHHTQRSLAVDTENNVADTGRVNLLCSYWYEAWEPRAALDWWELNDGRPIIADVVDKAAAIVYSDYCTVTYSIAPADTVYVLTAYPARLKEYKADRMTPEPGFWNIYRVTAKDK